MARGVLGVEARDLFPDGAFVGLKNRAQKTYLSADDDGEGVSLRPRGRGFSLTAVWRAHHVVIGNDTFVLLQGAAYGRYLAIEPGIMGPTGCRGHRALQRNYDGGKGTNVGELIWSRFRMVDDDRYIVLHHAMSSDRNLRANGRYRFWHTVVTADVSEARWSTMMQWTVRRFEAATGLPPLPPPTANPGGLRGLFRRRRPEEEADEWRWIRYRRANDEGDYDKNYRIWPTFFYDGRSLLNLMTQVGKHFAFGEVGVGITLAVRPGCEGRLTPLVTDLPRSHDTMYIVVFNTGSQGAQNLVYPDIQ